MAIRHDRGIFSADGGWLQARWHFSAAGLLRIRGRATSELVFVDTPL